MLVFGIILIIVSIIGMVVIAVTEKSEYIAISFLLGVFFIFGVALCATSGDDFTEKSLKDNTLNIEIRQELLNGQEISRDTVYIFTPKKKN